MAIEPGDVVMLKSGGQPMTVISIEEEDEIDCVWMSDDGRLFRESLPAAALIPISLDDDEKEEESDEDDESDEDENEDDEDDEDDDEDDEDEDDDEEDDEPKGKRRIA